MKKYSNSTGKSAITHYEVGDDFIRIQYKDRMVEYTVARNSKADVEEMKALATSGLGLCRFIRKNKMLKEPIVLKIRTGVFQRLKLMFSLV